MTPYPDDALEQWKRSQRISDAERERDERAAQREQRAWLRHADDTRRASDAGYFLSLGAVALGALVALYLALHFLAALTLFNDWAL